MLDADARQPETIVRMHTLLGQVFASGSGARRSGGGSGGKLPPRPKFMKRNIAIVLILIAAGVAAWWYLAPKVGARGGPLVVYGNVDIREVNLGFRVSGKINEVLKDEGDPVKPGELVARLDDAPYVRQEEQARGQLMSLQAKLAELEAGYRKEEIAQARAGVEESKAALDNAERVFNRRRDLLKQKVATQQEFDDATAARDQAQARLNSVRANLTLQEAGYRKEDIAQARADAERAAAALAAAKISVADTDLKAPSVGVVITRALEPGTVVQAGATVLTVSLSEPIWVRAYLPEPELGKVHPGMKALVFTDSRPGKPYEGQVGFISPRAEFTPKSVETTDLRTGLVYRLRVVIPTADQELRQGMPVTVKLIGP